MAPIPPVVPWSPPSPAVIWRALHAPVVPGRALDIFRRGAGVCWAWLSLSLLLGFSAWNPFRYPVIWQARGVRIPWRETSWVPVWSPVPEQGMAWLLIPMFVGGLLLVLRIGNPRPLAAGLLFLAVWLGATDKLMYLFHRYLIVNMAVVLLLLPARGHGANERVSWLDCLPLLVLCMAMWAWSAWAKVASDWPIVWGSQLAAFGPPAVDAAFAWLFDNLPRVPTILAGSILTAAAECLVALCLCWPRFTRAARRAGLLLCAGFALLAPLFAFGAAVLTWTAGHCLESGRAADRRQEPPNAELPAPNVRNLLTMLFLAVHLALPLRAYLSPAHELTHRGHYWAWRQMGDVGAGSLTVEAYDPARAAWQDLTPAWRQAHPDLIRQLSVYPCDIPWALDWLARNHPELVPPDSPLRLSMPPSEEAPVPAACGHQLPARVEQVGSW